MVLPLVEPTPRGDVDCHRSHRGLAALLFLGAVGGSVPDGSLRLPQGYLTALGVGTVAATVAGCRPCLLGWFGLIRNKLQHLEMVAAIQGDLMQLLRRGWRWVPLLLVGVCVSVDCCRDCVPVVSGRGI